MNARESADLMLSMTDEVRPGIPFTNLTKIDDSQTPCKDFDNNCMNELNLLDDYSDIKSVRSSSRAILKNYSYDFDGE